MPLLILHVQVKVKSRLKHECHDECKNEMFRDSGLVKHGHELLHLKTFLSLAVGRVLHVMLKVKVVGLVSVLVPVKYLGFHIEPVRVV